MDDFETRGWAMEKQSYWHYCGARVAKQGQLWTATSIAGATFPGYPTALEAMSYLEKHDPSFWSCGRAAIWGGAQGVLWTIGFLDAARQERAYTFHLNGGDGLPEFLKPVFKKHLFGKVHCNRFLSPMSTLETRTLRELDRRASAENAYFVCNCGYPVWSGQIGGFEQELGRAAIRWRRKERLREAGGHHPPSERHEILALQEYRCIYCNVKFTNEIPPSADHLLPVADGGTNWGLNIVMACLRCNFRRSDIPFRTYWRLLSQRQNRRILIHLARRILAMDIPNLPSEAVDSFDDGLAHHDARHPRFVNMRNRAIAGRNAATNQLLPRTRNLVLEKVSSIGSWLRAKSSTTADRMDSFAPYEESSCGGARNPPPKSSHPRRRKGR